MTTPTQSRYSMQRYSAAIEMLSTLGTYNAVTIRKAIPPSLAWTVAQLYSRPLRPPSPLQARPPASAMHGDGLLVAAVLPAHQPLCRAPQCPCCRVLAETEWPSYACVEAAVCGNTFGRD